MSGILQKIRRNEKKCEKIKSKIFFQKSKTGNVLGRSLRLSKTILVSFGSLTGSE